MTRKLAFIMLYLIMLFLFSFSYENGDFTVCDSESNYSINYDYQASKLIVGCCKPCSEVLIVDPNTLEITKEFAISGNMKEALFINNGIDLLLLMSATDNDTRTEEGKLIKLNYNTEQIVDELLFDNWPQDMVVDNNESYCYVVSGLTGERKAKLHKVRLSDLMIVDTVDNQEGSDDIEITPNGLKLYSNNTESHPTAEGTGFAGLDYCWHVNVYNTNDLSLITYIEILENEPCLKMGNNNKLYITNPCPLFEEDWVLYVVDTLTDAIIQRKTFDNIGLWQIGMSVPNNTLYMTTWLDNLWDFDYLQYVHQPSNTVIAIDLSDYSYQLINMGLESLHGIAVANINGIDRIFCTSEVSAKIFYKDIEQ